MDIEFPPSTMWPADPDWQLTLLFLSGLTVMGFAMKLVAWRGRDTMTAEHSIRFWLLLAPASQLRLRPIPNLSALFGRMALLGGELTLGYWIHRRFLHDADIPRALLSYAAVPMLLLISELLLLVVAVVWLPSGRMLPALHDRPWRADSIADFWGRRWNLWFSDWFRCAIFRPLRRRPVLALFLTFAVSGVMHEGVVNLPLYLVTGRALFGSMMLYFLLQAIGMLLERRLGSHPLLKRVFAWLVVLAPAPLVLNEGLLRMLHWW